MTRCIPRVILVAQFLVLAAVGNLAGCAPSYPWTGKWRGQIDPSKPINDPIDGSMRRVELVIENNNHFVLTVQGFPLSGDAFASGTETRFTIDKVMDQPYSRQEKQIQEAYADPKAVVVDADNIRVSWGPKPQTEVTLHRERKPSVAEDRR